MTKKKLKKCGTFSSFFQIASGKIRNTGNESGVGMLMNLRKIANHPLLSRHHFDNSQISTLARMLKKDPSHQVLFKIF